jgi:hypothetical protein
MWMTLWGKYGIAHENARKIVGINVDSETENYAGFWTASGLPVDRLLIGRHESNPRCNNNHYKDS